VYASWVQEFVKSTRIPAWSDLVILHEQMGEAAMRLTPTTLRNVMLSIAVQPSQYGSVGRNGEPVLSAGGDLAMECC
jgi:hypothetical protein